MTIPTCSIIYEPKGQAGEYAPLAANLYCYVPLVTKQPRAEFDAGANAGCDDDCQCSVPIHECTRCGACDYGDNEEGNETRRVCAEERALA